MRFDERIDPSLEEISEKIINCQMCKLAETRTNAVPGEGPQDARLFFVGEGPGKKEDETGRPFVGQAGRLFDQLLEEVAISREEVFITSVLKCRPPENRSPHREEVKSCLPYLLSQVDSVCPVVIIAMGNSAYDVFSYTFYLPKKKVGDIRGKVFHLSSTGAKVLIPTYHPAGLLYNRKLIPLFIEDLKRAKDQLRYHR